MILRYFAVLTFVASTGLGDETITAFWRSTLTRLAAEPMEATIEDSREPLPYKKYRVTYRSLGGVRVHALLALPIRGGSGANNRMPAIVTAPGYGGLQQGVMLDECQRGYAILQVFLREVSGGERLTWRLREPDGSYYQSAYADVIRGIDFLVTHADVDRNAIAAVGTSQGGGIALAVASLDPRVKAVVAHVPFLCSVRTAAATPGALIKQLLDNAGLNDERHVRSLEHFDPLNLVSSLSAPVLLSSGGKDTTCPPGTVRAVFNRIPGVKSLFDDPELPHTSSGAFYRMTWDWLALWMPNRAAR